MKWRLKRPWTEHQCCDGCGRLYPTNAHIYTLELAGTGDPLELCLDCFTDLANATLDAASKNVPALVMEDWADSV